MKSWKTQPLLDVARLTRGTEPGSESYITSANGVRFLRVGDITGKTDNPIHTNATKLVLVTENDLLVALDGTPGLVSTGYRGAISSGIRKVDVLDKQTLSLSWLRYALNSPDVQVTIKRHTRGITILHASSAVSHIHIPIPPMVEQERIVTMLNEADKLRKLRTQADDRTAAIIPALFHEMFGDPEHTRLSLKPLIELVLGERPITYGILKPGPDIEDGVPYVRVLDIKQSRLHVEQLRKTTREIANQYRRSTLCPGDILVTIRGTVGRTCIVPHELTGANITQDTARLAIIPSIEPVYVVEFLNTPWAQSWMNHHSQGQAVKGINLGDLKKLPVPVPPSSSQREFTKRVTEIREMETAQSSSRQRLDDLFQSMLHRAFNGEL